MELLLKFDMSILGKIVEKKKDRLIYAKSRHPLKELKALIRDIENPGDFKRAIKKSEKGIRLIAEIKKASPSAGLIRKDFNHVSIATVYEEKHVDAISVITEEDFFQGRLDFLPEVKKITSQPILRKDFLVDEYQLYESRANKADAVLLIASLLDLSQAEEYMHLSLELGMTVLFEVHDIEELETALKLEAPVIGINNRNLKTLQIDLDTTLKLRKVVPGDRIVVSESGIETRADFRLIESAGVDAVLIGTTLINSEDIGLKIDELRGL